MTDVEYIRFDHVFSVSKDGKVLRHGIPYKPRIYGHGYLVCGGKKLLHRMVATVWIRPPLPGEHIHHKNHNRLDNRAENLEWLTPAKHMNERHADHVHRFAHSKMSPKGRAKLRALRLGTKMSEKTKRKIGKTIKRLGIRPPINTGRPPTEKVLAALRAAKCVPCEVHGIRYESFSAAGKALGEKPLSLRKRCLSSNFPEYRLIK